MSHLTQMKERRDEEHSLLPPSCHHFPFFLWLSSFDRKEPFLLHSTLSPITCPFSIVVVVVEETTQRRRLHNVLLSAGWDDNEHNGRRISFVKWVNRLRSRSQMMLFKSRVIQRVMLKTCIQFIVKTHLKYKPSFRFK